MKYRVSFGWEICDDQMVTDYTRVFDSKEDAEVFQNLIWKNNTKEYDMSQLEEIKA